MVRATLQRLQPSLLGPERPGNSFNQRRPDFLCASISASRGTKVEPYSFGEAMLPATKLIILWFIIGGTGWNRSGTGTILWKGLGETENTCAWNRVEPAVEPAVSQKGLGETVIFRCRGDSLIKIL